MMMARILLLFLIYSALLSETVQAFVAPQPCSVRHFHTISGRAIDARQCEEKTERQLHNQQGLLSTFLSAHLGIYRHYKEENHAIEPSDEASDWPDSPANVNDEFNTPLSTNAADSLLRSAVRSIFPKHSYDENAREARILTPLKSALSALIIGSGTATLQPAAATAAVTPSYTTSGVGNTANLAATTPSGYASSLNQYFATSVPVSTLSSNVVSALQQRGYEPTNTVLMSSLCSDESNEGRGTIMGEIKGKLPSSASVIKLGALAGLPLYATSSLDSAFSSAASGKGQSKKILIVHGPHIGIGSEDGIVGKRGTGACGTALGAYRTVLEQKELERIAKEKKSSAPLAVDKIDDSKDQAKRGQQQQDQFDVLSLVANPRQTHKDTLREVQEEYIINELRKRLTPADLSNPDQNAAVAKVIETTYSLINELLTKEVEIAAQRTGLWDRGDGDGVEVALLGGIIVRGDVSRGSYEDWFNPLAFTSLKPGPVGGKAKMEDLLPVLAEPAKVAKVKKAEKEDTRAAAETKAEVEQRLAKEEAERKAAEETRAAEEAARAEQRLKDEVAERQRIAQAAENERREKERLAAEEAEKARLAAKEKLEQQRLEQERIAAEKEAERKAVADAKARQGLLKKEEADKILREAANKRAATTPVSPPSKGKAVVAPAPSPKTDFFTRQDASASKGGGANVLQKLAYATFGGSAVAAALVASESPGKRDADDDQDDGFPSKLDPNKAKVPAKWKGRKGSDEPLFSTSSRYRSGFPPSYLDTVAEVCDPDEAAAALEECAPAVKEYFEAVSKGDEQPASEGSQVIGSYLDALSSGGNQRSQARVISPASSGPAVESYLNQLSSGEVKPPPSTAVNSYLDQLSEGGVNAPSTAEEINTMMYSIIETMKPPKLQIVEEVCDPDEPAEVVEECADAVKDYLDAVSEGTEEPEADAPKVIGSYLDALSSNDGQASSASSGPAVGSYLNELSTGSMKPPPSSSGVTSYLDAISSGQIDTPTTAEELDILMEDPSTVIPETEYTPRSAGFGSYIDSLGGSNAPYSAAPPPSTLAEPVYSVASPSAKPNKSYGSAIYEECAAANGPSESCVAAISSYLDALAIGATGPEQEANKAVVSYMEWITGTSCGPAVLEYLDHVASSGNAPSVASLSSYFDGLASGRISPPSWPSGNSMSLYLDQ